MGSIGFGHLVATVLATTAAPPAATGALVLEGAAPEVDAVINGVPLRLRVEFDMAPDVNLNPEAAARAGLGRGDSAWVQRIGPVRLRGRSARTDIGLAGVKTRTAVRWHDRPVASGVDGLVSVHALPFDSVTIARRGRSPGETELTFRVRIDDNHGVYVPIDLGGRRIAARISLYRSRTIAPAAAAAVIARRHGGEIEREAAAPEEISLGVFRPVRMLELERPLAVGGLTVSRLMVRTSDFRGDHRLARRALEDGGSAIVVNGERRSQEPLYRITIGLDVLEPCSMATYSRATRELRLLCDLD